MLFNFHNDSEIKLFYFEAVGLILIIFLLFVYYR
jgi:hypothetical protein